MKKLTVLIFIFISITGYAQTVDSLLYNFNENLKVYKNLRSNEYSVRTNKGNTQYDQLKYVGHLGLSLQVLDKNTNLFYINENGEKEQDPNISMGLCGTVPDYTYEIKAHNGMYILTKNESWYGDEKQTPPVVIDSIEMKDIDKIYFINGEKQIKVDGNAFAFNQTQVFPYALIVEKGNKKGVFFKSELSYYDEVGYDDGLLKVKNNNKYGYYKITKTKYKELESFNFGLARFKTMEGKAGYIDSLGNEYFK